jgi:TAP-like protein
MRRLDVWFKSHLQERQVKRGSEDDPFGGPRCTVASCIAPGGLADVERMILSTPIAGYEGCAEALKRLDYLKDLHHITIPTLFVGGAEDMAAPPEAMQAMADRIRGSRFSIIAGGAHLSNIDSSTGFHDAVKDFLQLDQSTCCEYLDADPCQIDLIRNRLNSPAQNRAGVRGDSKARSPEPTQTSVVRPVASVC